MLVTNYGFENCKSIQEVNEKRVIENWLLTGFSLSGINFAQVLKEMSIKLPVGVKEIEESYSMLLIELDTGDIIKLSSRRPVLHSFEVNYKKYAIGLKNDVVDDVFEL